MTKEELKGIIKEIILEKTDNKITSIIRFYIRYANLLKFV